MTKNAAPEQPETYTYCVSAGTRLGAEAQALGLYENYWPRWEFNGEARVSDAGIRGGLHLWEVTFQKANQIKESKPLYPIRGQS
jgi:hypothetical protein